MVRYVLRFMALGALLFVAQNAWTALRPGEVTPLQRDAIVIDEEVVERLVREAVAQGGRPDDPRELQLRAEAWVDEEILYREARLLSLDAGDPVIYMRLVRNMRFVEDDPERSDDEMYEEALALGMDRSDLVVRRRLVQQMRFLVEAAADVQPISDAELQAYLETHPERFEIPARVRLTQLHLSRDRRGAATRADASALREALVAEGLGPDEAQRRGDPFLHPAVQPLQSERQLAKHFGPDFARAAMAPGLALESWIGPLESAYGEHVVWLHERQPARPPALETVRTAVEGEIRSERRRAVMTEQLAKLRAEYEVVWPERFAS